MKCNKLIARDAETGNIVKFTRRGYSNIQVFLTLIMVCPLVADDANISISVIRHKIYKSFVYKYNRLICPFSNNYLRFICMYGSN